MKYELITNIFFNLILEMSFIECYMYTGIKKIADNAMDVRLHICVTYVLNHDAAI